ncbi:phosphonate C-P lyase system protein PhnG [Paenibacillus sp. SYP-B3998]|nr:phosphonate C-P lyase system protein PhnG [Paenibacillus sp. SYP-B3998]
MRERTEIAATVPESIWGSWKQRIEALGTIEVIHPASMGLVMMKAEESVAKEVFHVGEILTTDATLTLDGVLGYGIVMGNHPDKAFTFALLDALYHSTDKKWIITKQGIDAELMRQAEEQKQQKQRHYQLIKRTMVNFEVMDAE